MDDIHLTDRPLYDRFKSIFINTVSTIEFYFIVYVMYHEMVFHFVRFGMTADNLIYKVFFAAFYGLIAGTVVSIMPKKVSGILNIVLSVLITVYFIIQIIYSGVFGTYLSVAGSAGMTGQAFDFVDVIWREIKGEWWVLLVFLLPLILDIVLIRKFIRYERHRGAVYGLQCAGIIVLFTALIVAMNSDKSRTYSAYEVYSNYTSVDMSVKKLGVTESLWLDAKAGIKESVGVERSEVAFAVEDSGEVTISDATTQETSTLEMSATEDREVEASTEDTTEKIVDTSPNVLDIDFDELIENAPNANIANLHSYVQSVTPTNKNEYTGMFEGYNLIFVVAEGFSGYVIDRQRTPMLYEMSHKGFYFNNYYTPLWYGSTVGGEYADLTGLMPKNGSYLSMNKVGRNKNDMMFTLGKQLSSQGYTTMGFHNNDYTYYDRDISHQYLGYEWIGMGNGLTYEKDENGNCLWPQSDVSMIDNTFDLYSSKEPFHTYYLTVSGHVMYNFGGNAMAKRHQDLVEDLDYSETTKAYIACQYELELAMEKLVDKLYDAGIAENTLIVLTADHVPYDNKEVVDELAGATLDNTFGWYKNTLIIWSPSMEHSVRVKKYCSSLDVLPTVSNLMGLPYDSRMMVGQDILSDSEPLVMFNDRSFITDKCFYNASTGQVTSINGDEISEEYIQNKIAQVKNKFNMAELICEYDYYKYIDEAVYGVNGEE